LKGEGKKRERARVEEKKKEEEREEESKTAEGRKDGKKAEGEGVKDVKEEGADGLDKLIEKLGKEMKRKGKGSLGWMKKMKGSVGRMNG
jgi:hypothetical protein